MCFQPLSAALPKVRGQHARSSEKGGGGNSDAAFSPSSQDPTPVVLMKCEGPELYSIFQGERISKKQLCDLGGLKYR